MIALHLNYHQSFHFSRAGEEEAEAEAMAMAMAIAMTETEVIIIILRCCLKPVFADGGTMPSFCPHTPFHPPIKWSYVLLAT